MQSKRAMNLLCAPNYLNLVHNASPCLNAFFYRQLQEPPEDFVVSETAFWKLNKLTQMLKTVDMINGKLVSIEDNSPIKDDRMENSVKMFKSITRAFLGSPPVQQALENKKKMIASSPDAYFIPKVAFCEQSEREPMILNTLTKVCNYLNISAQQRKSVRLTICPQVTQHRIWTGALEEILKDLKSEIGLLNRQSATRGVKLSEQIISNCLRFLDETDISSAPDSTSWMRLTPKKKVGSLPSRQWEDLVVLVNDLIKCLRNEDGFLYHVSKLEVMKEGLYQIKDVLVDKDIGYKEARHQESLVQKKLSKTLGHSSPCLFTLLQYYLYGSVRDPEVDVCGGVYEGSEKGKRCLCIGRILTSNEEEMVWTGMKQLDMALGLFKFLWEAAGSKEDLELQGHLWCVGAEDGIHTYRAKKHHLRAVNVIEGRVVCAIWLVDTCSLEVPLAALLELFLTAYVTYGWCSRSYRIKGLKQSIS